MFFLLLANFIQRTILDRLITIYYKMRNGEESLFKDIGEDCMIRNTERKQIIHCNLMTVFFAAAFNPKAAVVLHVPKSCSHIVYNAFWEMAFKHMQNSPKYAALYQENMFVTGISDKEAIFGGEKILRKCLLEVIAAKRPEYVVVTAGCTASVIGDDVEAICKEVAKETGTDIFYIPGSGFMDQTITDGTLSVTKSLVKGVVFPKAGVAKNPRSIVALGVNAHLSKEYEVAEMTRIFKLFGFEKIYYPPVGMSKSDLEAMAEAAYITTLGLSPTMIKNTQQYAKEYARVMGIQDVTVPIVNTAHLYYAWLQSFAQLLGKTEILPQLLEAEEQAYREYIAEHCQGLQGKTVLLGIGAALRYFEPMETVKLLEDAGLKVIGVVFIKGLTTAERKEHEKHFQGKLEVPYWTEEDLAHLQADALLTTETKECHIPQYAISFRRVGRAGIENFYQGLVRLIIGQRNLLYEY